MMKLKFLAGASKDKLEVAKELVQTINISDNYNEVTNFLTLFEQEILKEIINYNYPNMKIDFFGGYNDSERKKAKLIANEYYDIDYEIVCLQARFNSKFLNIEHRDVLGAVYNLGLNYNRIGDIYVTQENIYIFVDKTIADFIIMNLGKIGRASINFKEISLQDINISKKYEVFEIVSSSFRLDSIVAKITNKSRSKVKEMLEQEFIKINHAVTHSGEKNCQLGDIISIRRFGRFTLTNSKQNSKSLKYRIEISKLV